MAETPKPNAVLPNSGGLDSSAYEAVFRSSQDGILIADDDACYLDVNDAACAIVGRTREELIGRPVGTFVEHPGDARQLWEKALQAGSLRAEISLIRPDGQRRYIEFTAVAHFQPG